MSSKPITAPDSVGVIVGRDLIGDALIKLPFLRAMRAAWPNARIHWITSQGATAYSGQLREVTRLLIDEVHETPRWLEVEDHKPDGAPPPFFSLIIDTRNRWKEALRARRSVPHGTFIAPAFRFLFSDIRPSLFAPRPRHMVDRMLQLIELAAGYSPATTGRLPVPASVMAKARTILPDGQTYIGFAPGAGNPAKVWPRYKFEKVAATQAAKGRVPVFLLGPQELDWFDVLASSVPSAVFPLQEYDIWGSAAITVEQTLAVGSLLSAAVANDSGTGHMLAAVDCPLVSLFGITSPDKLAPRVTYGRVIKSQDFGSEQISAIRWEVVDEAVDELVKIRVSGS